MQLTMNGCRDRCLPGDEGIALRAVWTAGKGVLQRCQQLVRVQRNHPVIMVPCTRQTQAACPVLATSYRPASVHRTGADAWSPTFLGAHAAAIVPCCIDRRSSSTLSSHGSAAYKLGRGITSTVQHHIGTLGGIRPRTGPQNVTWARPGPSCRQGAHQW